VARHHALVVVTPGLGAAGGDAAGAFRLDELDAARIREAFLGGIHDLNDVTMGAAAGELRECALHVADRAPQIGEHHDLRQRRGRESRRQAGAFGAVMQDRFRHLLDHVAAGGRPHQPGQADALAALHQHFGECEGDHQRALDLALGRQRRNEGHRRRTVGPEPDGVRGLPFALAHIKMVVARGAPPVDVLGRLAGGETPVLPEVLGMAAASERAPAVA
jgi:hypothetical protein